MMPTLNKQKATVHVDTGTALLLELGRACVKADKPQPDFEEDIIRLEIELLAYLHKTKATRTRLRECVEINGEVDSSAIYPVAIVAYYTISNSPLRNLSLMKLAELATRCMMHDDSPPFEYILRMRAGIDLMCKFMPALSYEENNGETYVRLTTYLKDYVSGICINEPPTDPELDKYADACIEAYEKKAEAAKPIWTPQSLYKELCKHVVGQQDAAKTLSVHGYLHLKRYDLLKAGKDVGRNQCLFFIGDSSSGKTLLAETYASLCGTPFASFDATSASSVGYYGADIVSDSFNNLLRAIGKGDNFQDRIRKSTLFIDEFSKKCSSGNSKGDRDIVGTSVQFEILRAMEGADVLVNNRRSRSTCTINTRGVMFIFAGYIDGYEDIVKKLKQKNALGFHGQSDHPKKGTYIYDCLVEYNLIPEFINRLTAIVPFRKLTLANYIQIAKFKYGAIQRQNDFLQHQGVQIRFSKSAYKAMATVAVETSGARAIEMLTSALVRDIVFNESKGTVTFEAKDIWDVAGRIE